MKILTKLRLIDSIKKNKQYKILFILHLLIFPFTFSCQSQKEVKNEKTGFVYAEISEIKNLDPLYLDNRAEEWISGQVFNTLFELDGNLELYPVLIESYNLSADSLTYHFELKKNIYFHPCTAFEDDTSREMTAKDVIFSFKRLEKFPQKNVIGKFLLQDTSTHSISDTALVVIDKYNFKIHLDTTYTNFLGLLALPNTKIVSQKAVKHFRRKFRTKPIGTGAFCIDSWTNDEAIILKANEDYFKKDIPKTKSIQINRAKSQLEISKQFRGQELDFVYMDRKAWQKADLGFIKEDSGYYENILSTCYIGFLKDSLSQSLFKDPNKRIKLASSIDYQGLIDSVLFEFASLPKQGFTPPLLPVFIEKDRKKLPNYFLNDSIKNKLKTIFFTLDIEKSDERIARYLKKNWKKEGVYVKIRVHTAKELQNLIKNKQSNCYLVHHQGKYANARSFFEQVYPSQDSLFDSLYRKSLYTTSFEEQEKTTTQMEHIIRKNALVIPLFYEKIWLNTQPNIKGVEIQAINKLQLEYVIIE